MIFLGFSHILEISDFTLFFQDFHTISLKFFVTFIYADVLIVTLKVTLCGPLHPGHDTKI